MGKYCLSLVMEESVFELTLFLSCSLVMVQSQHTAAGISSSYAFDPATTHFALMAAQMAVVY